MDCPLETYITPTVRNVNQEPYCGAFYNLARVIGKGENRGVPEQRPHEAGEGPVLHEDITDKYTHYLFDFEIIERKQL